MCTCAGILKSSSAVLNRNMQQRVLALKAFIFDFTTRQMAATSQSLKSNSVLLKCLRNEQVDV